jgi:hypothetical protein
MKLIMQNEPNLGQSQIFITSIKTTSYNKKTKLDTWSKRTQTKPILSAVAPVLRSFSEKGLAKEDLKGRQAFGFAYFPFDPAALIYYFYA